jgi:curved DNA-binding protein CbpA
MAGEKGWYRGEQWGGKDYYAILGVPKGASANEIRSAWRKFALKYHPDRNPGDKVAEEKFKSGAEAYDILGDSDKRKRYDSFSSFGDFSASGEGSGSDSARSSYEETRRTSHTEQQRENDSFRARPEPEPQPKPNSEPKKPNTFKERFEIELEKEREKAKRWQERFGIGKKKE